MISNRDAVVLRRHDVGAFSDRPHVPAAQGKPRRSRTWSASGASRGRSGPRAPRLLAPRLRRASDAVVVRCSATEPNLRSKHGVVENASRAPDRPSRSFAFGEGARAVPWSVERNRVPHVPRRVVAGAMLARESTRSIFAVDLNARAAASLHRLQAEASAEVLFDTGGRSPDRPVWLSSRGGSRRSKPKRPRSEVADEHRCPRAQDHSRAPLMGHGLQKLVPAGYSPPLLRAAGHRRASSRQLGRHQLDDQPAARSALALAVGLAGGLVVAVALRSQRRIPPSRSTRSTLTPAADCPSARARAHGARRRRRARPHVAAVAVPAPIRLRRGCALPHLANRRGPRGSRRELVVITDV
jgi:hypothetical protein